MSHLAYMSNRSFVFEDYVLSCTPLPYAICDFALRPKRIPFNAFISGPTACGPISPPSSSSSHLPSQRPCALSEQNGRKRCAYHIGATSLVPKTRRITWNEIC